MSSTTDPSGNSYGYPASILQNVPPPYLPASPPQPTPEPSAPPAEYPTNTITSQPHYIPSPPGPYPEPEKYPEGEKPSFTDEEKCCIAAFCCELCVTNCFNCFEILLACIPNR